MMDDQEDDLTLEERLEEHGECVASYSWDSGGMASGTFGVWSYQGHFVMWDDWSGMETVVYAKTLVEALKDLDFLYLSNAVISFWAAIDTDELIGLLRPLDGAEGVFTTEVNGVEVEVDAEAGTVRRVPSPET